MGTIRGFWGLVASIYIGNAALLLLNLPLVGLFVRLLRVPRRFLMPAVAAVSFVAVYAANNGSFDRLLMTGLDMASFLLRKASFPLVPVIWSWYLVLGRLIEKNVRRALTLSGGDHAERRRPR